MNQDEGDEETVSPLRRVTGLFLCALNTKETTNNRGSLLSVVAVQKRGEEGARKLSRLGSDQALNQTTYHVVPSTLGCVLICVLIR